MRHLVVTLVIIAALFAAPAAAELVGVYFVDPTGEDSEANVDVSLFVFGFDNVTGDYRITIYATAGKPFAGDFRVNVNLYNPDTPWLENFFQYSQVETGFASSTTYVVAGNSAVLRGWRIGERIATNNHPAGNPPGAISFRSAVDNYPPVAPPPEWDPSGTWPDDYGSDYIAGDFPSCSPSCNGILAIDEYALITSGPIDVTTTSDELNNDGDCSLREAIRTVNTQAGVDQCGPVVISPMAQQIRLPAGTFTLSLTGSGENASLTGDLDLLVPVTIQGAGAGSTIIDAGGIDRVFEVPSSGVALADLTVRGGQADIGGGIYNWGSSDLLVNRVVVEDNHTTSDGGGVRSDAFIEIYDSTVRANTASGWGGGVELLFGGSAVISRSTIAGNESSSAGGGLAFYADATADVRNSTISDNRADLGGGIFAWGNVGVIDTLFRHVTIADNHATTSGGGIHNVDAAVATDATIVAGNTSGGGTPDECVGAVTYDSYNVFASPGGCTLVMEPGGVGNVFGVDPWLLPLADNGGPTPTRMLAAVSPVAGIIDCTLTETYDQRGTARGDGPSCNPGATEGTVALAPLAGLWRFDEGSGTVAADSSGNDAHGVIQGASWIGSDPDRGTVLSFDGVDDEVVVNAWLTDLATGDFSLTAWVKIPAGNAGSLILKGDGDDNWEQGEKTWWLGDGTACCSPDGETPSFVGWGNEFLIASEEVPTVDWHHLAVTWDYASGTTGVGAMYLDGLQVPLSWNTYFANEPDNPGDVFYIGRDGSYEAQHDFLGLLDDVAVWSGALTPAEVTAVMNGDYEMFFGPTIFADGFEGGSASAWSTSLP